MGSLVEELERRKAAARAETDRLRARIGELTEELARAEEQVRVNRPGSDLPESPTHDRGSLEGAQSWGSRETSDKVGHCPCA